uniref:TNF receptor superfamily member 11b n=1 Tax=Neogobius melanostomus TaxID=47308 RepID=A0A8C6US12_9GOBI
SCMASCQTCPLFTASLSWAFQQQDRPKYQHWDPVTSEALLCDQCPPGTSVKHHCTAHTQTECQPCPDRHFTKNWHWGEKCQHCTAVCKERQLVKQQCNSTHDQLCECAPGFHLEVEFCIAHTMCPQDLAIIMYLCSFAGTALSDTVCERCSAGHFSASHSSTELCRPHRNCSSLGLKTRQWGTSSIDSVCGPDKTLDCYHHHSLCHTDVTLCEEAAFESLSSLQLSSVPLERILEHLPGRRVDHKSVEHLKKSCSPQQQVLQLLRLWREQNKDQSKLSVIQGVNLCERKFLRCSGLKNMTLHDLLQIRDSLPGARVPQEAILAVVQTCTPRQFLLQLLHLWKTLNSELDLAKGLSRSLRVLRSQGAPRHLLKGLKKIRQIIGNTSAHKIYKKMFVNMLQDESCFKNHKPLNE